MRKLLLTLTAMLFFSGILLAQRVITGTVTDDKGAPLPNVSVSVKGTNTGTITKADGSFSLTLPSTARELEFSSLGFATQTVPVGGSNVYYIKLQAGADQDLGEVIVTGITRVKRSQFAGAASKISAKELENRPVGSFDQLLQGRAPGLLALTGSGQPGNPTTIIIRGQNSITGGSTPLYVVDGIPVEASTFQAINPNDIASLDVLRDAATQALYGSRGSAGVIVVTTKRGAPGRVKVSYNGQLGVKNTPDFAFRPMTTSEFLTAQRDYGQVLGITGDATNLPGWFFSRDNPRYATLTPAQQAAADRALDSLSQINTDWYDEFFRNGSFSNHEISISGGTGKTRVFTNIGLYNEQGIINPSDMKRATLRNNVDYADDKLSFSLSTALGYVKRNFDPAFPGFIFNSFLTPHIMSPYSRLYNDDGSFVLGGSGGDAKYFGAQYLDLKRLDKVYNDQVKVTVGGSLAYKITKDLTASVNAGVDFRETQASTYNSREAYLRQPSVTGSLTQRAGAQSESLTRLFIANVRPGLTYAKVFNEIHDVEVSAFGEYVQQNSKNLGYTGYGIDPRTPNTPGVITPGNSGNQLYILNTGTGIAQDAIVSALGIARYTYKNKYTVTGSYRNDGSSKLPEANRWTGFYSVGAIWDVTKENFARNIRALNSLRLRASYGGSGNHNNFPSSYLWQATYGSGSYSGLNTQVSSYVGNPGAKWESTYTFNVGVDFEVLNNRIYGSLDFYNKLTKDLFVAKPLAQEATGGATIQVNAGELQNRGFEWNLSGDVIRNKDLTWTLFASGAYNRNKLLSLGGEEPYEAGTSYLVEGLPLGSHYEVKWGGVDAATGAPLYYTKDGVLTNVYSASDAVTDFGTWEAPWKGGFGTNLRYKGFDLNVLFSWQQGANKVDNLEYFVENPNGFLAFGYNQSSDLRFWTKPGDVVSTPSPVYGTNFSSKIIHDASFVRLRDVVLSYSIPKTVLDKTRFISNARVFVQGSNLFMWTKWRGMDPEAGAVNINLSEFPNPRAFTGGVSITF